MEIPLETISQEAFAAFGQLLEADAALQRQNFAAVVQNTSAKPHLNLALLRAQPLDAKPIAVMERHLFSNQLFVPLDVGRYVVLVAADDGADAPDVRSLRAFHVTGRQAVNYFAGTWHMNMATLDEPGVFVMMIHEDGTPADCEFREVEPIAIRRRELDAD